MDYLKVNFAFLLSIVCICAASAEPQSSPKKCLSLQSNPKLIVVLDNPIDSENQTQKNFEGHLKQNVFVNHDFLLPANSKIIGNILHVKNHTDAQRVNINFRKIILSNGGELEIITVPSTQGGTFRVRRSVGQVKLDANICYLSRNLSATISRTVPSLTEPVACVSVKKSGLIHFRPGDQIIVEPAEEITTTLERWNRPYLRI